MEVRIVKRLVVLAALVAVSMLFALPVAAKDPACATIQSGDIVYPAGHYWAGQPVGKGADDYGFNYTAHRFSGYFVNADFGFWGLPPYEGDCDAYVAANPMAEAMLGPCADPNAYWVLKDLQLDIKWNDDYRSDTDCDGNGWFDRHYGYATYVGSGAWYTNHVSGTYFGEPAKSFSKVVAVPDDAVLAGSMWYTADGREIGYDARRMRHRHGTYVGSGAWRRLLFQGHARPRSLVALIRLSLAPRRPGRRGVLAGEAVMGRHIEVVVHRGLNQRAPENTYASAQRCVDLGLDYVEVDVRTSRDGVLHILHDPTVDRTTDGSGALAGLTADDLARLDAGSWFAPQFAGQRIPRLDEFLRWAKGRIKVYLDVKQAHPAQLLDLLYATDMASHCFLFCEQSDLGETFRALDSEIAIKANVSEPSDLFEARERLGAQIIEIGGRDLSDELVAACQACGHRVMVYTQADDAALFRRIMASGAEMVNLDHAETWLRVLAERERTHD